MLVNIFNTFNYIEKCFENDLCVLRYVLIVLWEVKFSWDVWKKYMKNMMLFKYKSMKARSMSTVMYEEIKEPNLYP
jgi:hypothetical protein